MEDITVPACNPPPPQKFSIPYRGSFPWNPECPPVCLGWGLQYIHVQRHSTVQYSNWFTTLHVSTKYLVVTVAVRIQSQ